MHTDSLSISVAIEDAYRSINSQVYIYFDSKMYSCALCLRYNSFIDSFFKQIITMSWHHIARSGAMQGVLYTDLKWKITTTLNIE